MRNFQKNFQEISFSPAPCVDVNGALDVIAGRWAVYTELTTSDT